MVSNEVFHFGDIISLSFDPQAGHEQKGRRPAIVISNDILNEHSAMCMVCPITNTDKEHPFHIKLLDTGKTSGVILCDQAKMLDVYARNARFIEKAGTGIAEEARELVKQFL